MSANRTLQLVGLEPAQAAEIAHLNTEISLRSKNADSRRRNEILKEAETRHGIRQVVQKDTAKTHTLWRIVGENAVQLSIQEILALKAAHKIS